MFFSVRITAEKLNELRMLADWQLREMGIDPSSVNEAFRELENTKEAEEIEWHDAADELEYAHEM